MVNAINPKRSKPVEPKAIRETIVSLAERRGLYSDRAITHEGSLEEREPELRQSMATVSEASTDPNTGKPKTAPICPTRRRLGCSSGPRLARGK